jgi:hypothetical protein
MNTKNYLQRQVDTAFNQAKSSFSFGDIIHHVWFMKKARYRRVDLNRSNNEHRDIFLKFPASLPDFMRSSCIGGPKSVRIGITPIGSHRKSAPIGRFPIGLVPIGAHNSYRSQFWATDVDITTYETKIIRTIHHSTTIVRILLTGWSATPSTFQHWRNWTSSPWMK